MTNSSSVNPESPILVDVTGQLEKMQVTAGSSIEYKIGLGDSELLLSNYLGHQVKMVWSGDIICRHCQQPTNKSFSQGYCYRCFCSLAACDQCMMSPEKCHFHLGTCREPEWAKQVCFNDHIVYLANSSGPKVGITRMKNIPSRWIDQGASQALPIFLVASRRLAGLLEDILRRSIADRTNWRSMLKQEASDIDLIALRQTLVRDHSAEIASLREEHGDGAVMELGAEQVRYFNYPVVNYPVKVVSQSFDKTSTIEGKLLGIKGQYLMLDTGVINIRKFSSYQINLQISKPLELF